MESLSKIMISQIITKKHKDICNIYCFLDKQEIDKCLCQKYGSKQSKIERMEDNES